MYLVHYIWNMLLFKKCKLCQIFFTLIRALTPARPEYQHWLLTSSRTQWKLSCLSPLSANSLGQALQLQNWPWGALTVITHMIVADSWYTTEESTSLQLEASQASLPGLLRSRDESSESTQGAPPCSRLTAAAARFLEPGSHFEKISALWFYAMQSLI